MSSAEPSSTVTHESRCDDLLVDRSRFGAPTLCVSEGEKGGSAFGRSDIVGVRRSEQQMPGRWQMML
jgi:hypothetical protein